MKPMNNRRWIWLALAAALLVGGLISGFASSSPDGLERVAEDQGFAERASELPLVASPLADYLFPGIRSERLATGLAGMLGTLLLFACGWAAARLLRRRGSA
jgi:cobalt/nickel transport protein